MKPPIPPRTLHALLFVCLGLAIWLPRGLALDRTVTIDEPVWLMRSANFYYALGQRDFGGTFQKEHPGVTAMWAGTAGFLARFRQYRGVAPGPFDSALKLERFLKEQGVRPIELLAWGRAFMALGSTAALLAAAAVAARLLGWGPALLGLALVAFDPFHIAHTRLLHLDGLVSSLMLLSLLAFMQYLWGGRQKVYLALSAAAAGLAWLTKSPALFLIPFVGLLALLDQFGRRDRPLAALRRAALPLAGWGLLALAVFVLLWPAMWVDPLGTLGRILAQSGAYATQGHGFPVFYNGRIFVQEGLGPSFYPVSYLWRSTPAVWGGLLVALPAAAAGRGRMAESKTRRVALGLLLFAGLFAVFMALGAKQFDRYLLPAYAPLDLAAALGWLDALDWLKARRPALERLAAPALLAAVVLSQLLAGLPTFPYYLDYFNPLMGGSARAPQVMSLGWGEGLDQAARYLNAKPNAAQLRVMSWYGVGPFSFFFSGETVWLHLSATWNAEDVAELQASDYLVTYVHQWQQRMVPRLLTALETARPEHVIHLNGLEYARIYAVEDLPPQVFDTD